MLAAAERYRKGLRAELEDELAPFLDERGRPEEAYRGAIRRIEERHKRRVRRAERDYVDWVLLAVSSLLRDRVVVRRRRRRRAAHEPRLAPDDRLSVVRAARGLGGDRGGAGRARRGAEPQPPARARAGVPAAWPSWRAVASRTPPAESGAGITVVAVRRGTLVRGGAA